MTRSDINGHCTYSNQNSRKSRIFRMNWNPCCTWYSTQKFQFRKLGVRIMDDYLLMNPVLEKARVILMVTSLTVEWLWIDCIEAPEVTVVQVLLPLSHLRWYDWRVHLKCTNLDFFIFLLQLLQTSYYLKQIGLIIFKISFYLAY